MKSKNLVRQTIKKMRKMNNRRTDDNPDEKYRDHRKKMEPVEAEGKRRYIERMKRL